MTANNRRTILIGALIIIFAAALLLLNFRLMSGQFRTEHQMFTSTFGNEGPQEIAQGQDVDLYVLGTNWLTGGITRSLSQTLEGKPYIRSMRMLEGPPQKSDHPVMVIQVDQADVLWALVYGRAQIKLHINYSSNGDIDWMDDETIVSMPGPYTKWIRGDFTASDNSFGLISLPGYSSYLGQQFGQRISEGIENALQQ